MATRRSYGTGSLYVRKDKNGRETWYGHWRASGRQHKRRIGPKRADGTRDGLTRPHAEKELRRLIAETRAPKSVTSRLTLEEVGAALPRAPRGEGTQALHDRRRRERALVWLLPALGRRRWTASARGRRGSHGPDARGDRPGDARERRARRRRSATTSGRSRRSTTSRCTRGARWATSNPCDGVELPAAPRATRTSASSSPSRSQALATAAAAPYQALDRALYRHGRDDRAAPGRADRAALARRRLDRRAHPRAPELRARRVRHAEEQAVDAQRCRWPTRSAASSTGCSRRRRWQARRRPRVRRPADRRAAEQGGDQPPVPQGAEGRAGSTRRTASTTCATRSGRGWPPPACRCGRCRSGWATATSRRRSATPTTRRAPARRSWSPPRSRPGAARGSNRGSNLSDSQLNCAHPFRSTARSSPHRAAGVETGTSTSTAPRPVAARPRRHRHRARSAAQPGSSHARGARGSQTGSPAPVMLRSTSSASAAYAPR